MRGNPGSGGPAHSSQHTPSTRDAVLSGAEFAGIGIQFALAILLFAAAGYWLDKRLGTAPWLLLVMVFVGAAGGFYSMYHRVMAAQRRDAEQRAEQRAAERRGPGESRQ